MLTVKDRKFYLDGEEFKIQSGSFHYFRALPEYWEDILIKIKAAGLNCVETYTCWNLHERKKGQFNFSGNLDVERFIRTADKVGLKVILRTGPYICAELENGGLPSWLLKKEYNIRLRCNTEPYITHLKEWFHVLLPKIRPYLDINGGPVIALAVENEYGSFGDDFSYLAEVEKIYKEEKMDCLYLAADGNKDYHLTSGKTENVKVYGMDFGGVGSKESFEHVNKFAPESPNLVIEYWAGNFTYWGSDKCTNIPNEVVKQSMENYVDLDASFNIYMVFGGTNFGFMNGATGQLTFRKRAYNACITSYDYDAAITEWGGYTQRYFDIKEAMERDHGKADIPVPPSPVLQNIGKVKLTESAPLLENLHIGKKHKSVTVESMEEFDQQFGYILYRKILEYDAYMDMIKLVGVHDRAHVFVNKKLIGTYMRGDENNVFAYERDFVKGDVIDILVENMGRINYGEDTYFGDKKGIDGGVLMVHTKYGQVLNPGKVMFNWDVICMEMDNPDEVNFQPGTVIEYPAFFKGTFKAENNISCFVHFENLTKGVIYVNGFNLGRYWDIGPLEALYLPGSILKEENEIIIFETEGIKGEPVVTINDICGIPNHHEEIIVQA